MVSAFFIIEQFPLLVITNLSEMSSALGGVSLHPSQDDKSIIESYTCGFANEKLLRRNKKKIISDLLHHFFLRDSL